jgi:hypothetical protein
MTSSESSQNLERCKLKIEQLNTILPSTIDYRDISLKAKIPFIVLGYSGALLHRVAELADSSVELYGKPKRTISAILLARAVMETTAMLYVLHRRVAEAVTKRSTSELREYLDTNIFGWRTEGEDNLPKMPNILGAIDQVDKHLLEGRYRRTYEGLSEYCHPNCAGVHMAYVKLDKINRRAHVGAEFTKIDTEAQLGALLSCLHIATDAYEKIAGLMKEFIGVCEYEIANKT